MKEEKLVDTYIQLRNMILALNPAANELLYHTHALTSVYSISEKLSDAFCHIPIYSNHLNLGFNRGTLLSDPDKLLEGTGKLIRHIPIKSISDFDNKKTKSLIKHAIEFATNDMTKETKLKGETISKIKDKK